MRLLCLPGTATDLGKEEINSKRGILVFEEGLEFGDLFPQHVWGIAYSSDDTETASIGNGCGEFGTCCNVHSCEQNRVIDLEQVGYRCADLLYSTLDCWPCGLRLHVILTW